MIRKLTDFLFLAPGAYLLFWVSNSIYNALSDFAAPPDPAGMSIPVIAGVACALILAAEFNAFLWHYIEHKIPFLWELHKVHHSADSLNPLTNTRAHSFMPAVQFAMNGFVSGVPFGLFMYYFGGGFVELLAISAISNKLLTVATLDALRHSHVPLRFGLLEGVFISPAMHHIHHSSLEAHWDKNFGVNLSLFDWMFGTAYRPRKGEEMVNGIYGYSPEQLEQFHSLRGTYWDPLVRSFESLKRSVSPASEVSQRSFRVE
jgi:sterol desaturase/sphingolipid hydroxylase (fatty acid hydroxylase superfamily)